MNAIIQRFAQALWEERPLEQSAAEALYQSLVPGDVSGTWCWGDIDYTQQQRSFWSAAKHYRRIQSILTSLGEERLMGDPVYAGKMEGALKYWLAHDFENPNWWHNQIGMPQGIGNIAILMLPVLGRDTRAHAAVLLEKGSMAKNEAIAQRWTGANLIWGTLNTIRHALLTEDAQLLGAAAERAAEEITIGMPEGIQNDYSFFQHGTRLYTGGYGRSFVYDMSLILFLLQETKYQFTPEKLDLFLSFVLDGLQPMTQGDALDWACIGREISRENAVKVGIIRRALERMLCTAELGRKQELRVFLDCINGAARPDLTKYFENAAMLCHHFNGIYVGAKFLNNRLLGAEICNGEGELCSNMSYGTHTCIMRSGNEYVNIDPVWDFSRIPGTTSWVETDEQLLAHRDWWSRKLQSDHSGGAQNGRHAVVYEQVEHDGISLLAADLAFEDGFVCLGTEIRAENADCSAVLVTTVDQCLLLDEVTQENGSVVHNAIRYSSLGNTQIEAKCAAQCGSWQRNNAALSDEQVCAQVLTLSITHPTEKAGTYAYMISAAGRTEPQVEVLRNDCEVQAIRLPDGSLMAVFHKGCLLATDGGTIIGEAGQIIC